MKAVFTDAKVIVDGDTAFLCIGIPFREAKQFVANKKEKPYQVQITEYSEKRSLDANAYFWQLVGKLAEALDITKEEIYLQYIKDYGIYKDFTLTESEAKTFRVAWQNMGTGWPTEQVDYDPTGDSVVIRAYYGSSQYNTKQMSRLIDAVVQDCKGQGIETLPPAELARLIEGEKQ